MSLPVGGCGGLFTCNNSVLAHWFKEKRGSALGYMAIGSALAGTVIPIMVKNLLPIVGFVVQFAMWN